MIQRIQTLFMILGGLAIVLLISNPLFSIGMDGNEEIWLSGLKEAGSGKLLQSTWPAMALAIAILVLLLFTILLFARRVLQMRLLVFCILLTVGLIGMEVFYILGGFLPYEGALKFQYVAIMPIASIVFNILAWRGVRKDYILIKAVNRIR